MITVGRGIKVRVKELESQTTVLRNSSGVLLFSFR